MITDLRIRILTDNNRIRILIDHNNRIRIDNKTPEEERVHKISRAKNKRRIYIMAYSISTIKRGKFEKMSALAGAFAVKIARERKDPLYEKMIRFKKAYKMIKRQIISKYGTKGKMAARIAASKTK
jgi:predicted ATP-dependent protease